MEDAVYCLASTEPQANDILTHLRNLGFSASEASILLKDNDTRNISVKEDVVRGSNKGRNRGRRYGRSGRANAVTSHGRPAACRRTHYFGPGWRRCWRSRWRTRGRKWRAHAHRHSGRDAARLNGGFTKARF
jgi:hypothetical protein